mgnify:CR=1 FL=1
MTGRSSATPQDHDNRMAQRRQHASPLSTAAIGLFVRHIKDFDGRGTISSSHEWSQTTATEDRPL